MSFSHGRSTFALTILLLAACCCLSLLKSVCLAQDGLPETPASWGVPLEIEAGTKDHRFVFDIQSGVESIFFDLVQAHEDLTLNMTYLDSENPVPDAAMPGAKQVLFFEMNLIGASGSIPRYVENCAIG